MKNENIFNNLFYLYKVCVCDLISFYKKTNKKVNFLKNKSNNYGTIIRQTLLKGRI